MATPTEPSSRSSRSPLDRELLRRFPVLRRYVRLRSVTGALNAAFVIGQCVALAQLLAALASDGPAGAARPGRLVFLGIVVLGRVVLSGWHRRQSETTASRWKQELREQAATALPARGIQHGGADLGAVVTLLSKGVDAVQRYLSTVEATLDAAVLPLGVLVTALLIDWPSALFILVTLPLAPFLLALAGRYTQSRTEKQLAVLLRLGNQFVEAVSGLVTLRVLGRQERTSARVRQVAEDHRIATVATLRMAFLSSLALETITTLSVALVAVPIGFRLLGGSLHLAAGLSVLLLTPEAFRPLRALGSQFHAAQDSKAMLDELRATLPAAPPVVVTGRAVPDPARTTIELRGLSVGFSPPVLGSPVPGSAVLGSPVPGSPVLRDISLSFEPGRHYALVGASGAGKSTLLRTIAGLLPPLAGSIRLGDVDLSEVAPHDWIERLAMVPQRPHLFTGTVLDNVRLGAPVADDNAVWHALDLARAADFVRALPLGLHTQLGERAGRLSAGQRQRLGIARALLRQPSLLLLDEPTARLDGGTEQTVLDALAGLETRPTMLIVTHRPRVLDRVDAVLLVKDGQVLEGTAALLEPALLPAGVVR